MSSAFTYWDDADRSPLSSVIEHWKIQVGGLDVVGDDEVTAIISKIAPAFAENYQRIAIPAARSDLARLVLLYERGGLYVDSHCGIIDADRTNAILQNAQSGDIIAVDRSRAQHPRPEGQTFLINAMIAGGRGSPHILAIAQRVIDNLETHRAREHAIGFRPYDLLELTGPASLNALTFERLGCGTKLLPHLVDQLTIYAEDDFPVGRHRYRLEADRSAHWSVRQKSELLFSTRR